MAQLDECIFCKIIRGQIPSTQIYEDESSLAFMDVNPASEGHTLVVAKDHAETLLNIETKTLTEVSVATQRVARAIQHALQPAGLRVSQFNGAAAGQTVFHYHVHIIPIQAGEHPGAHGRSPGKPEIIKKVADKIRAAFPG